MYGLPELYREEIATARLVANPGCYPTSVLLGLVPVAGEIDDLGVIVDSKSGVSGAGRTPSEKTHFCAVTEDFRSYSEVGHRHTSEMLQELALATGGPAVPVSFTPHLLPVDRGILSTIYFRPREGLHRSGRWLAKVPGLLRGRALRGGRASTCRRSLRCRHTNFCRITVREDKSGRPGEGVLCHRQSGEGRLGPGRAEHELACSGWRKIWD